MSDFIPLSISADQIKEDLIQSIKYTVDNFVFEPQYYVSTNFNRLYCDVMRESSYCVVNWDGDLNKVYQNIENFTSNHGIKNNGKQYSRVAIELLLVHFKYELIRIIDNMFSVFFPNASKLAEDYNNQFSYRVTDHPVEAKTLMEIKLEENVVAAIVDCFPNTNGRPINQLGTTFNGIEISTNIHLFDREYPLKDNRGKNYYLLDYQIDEINKMVDMHHVKMPDIVDVSILESVIFRNRRYEVISTHVYHSNETMSKEELYKITLKLIDDPEVVVNDWAYEKLNVIAYDENMDFEFKFYPKYYKLAIDKFLSEMTLNPVPPLEKIKNLKKSLIFTENGTLIDLGVSLEDQNVNLTSPSVWALHQTTYTRSSLKQKSHEKENLS